MSLYFTMGPICQRPTLYPTAPPARSPPFLSVLHFPPMETQCHWPAAGSPPRPTTGRPRSPPARALLVVPSRFPPLLASPRLPCLPRCARPCSGAGGGEGAWARPRGVATALSYHRARRSLPGATHRHGRGIPRLGGQRAARGSRAQRRWRARSHRLQLAPHAAVPGGGQPLRALPRPPRRGRGAPPQERRAPCRQRRRLTLLSDIGKQAATATIADKVRQLRFGLLCLSSARASPSCANRTCLTPARTASQPPSSVPPRAGAEAARRGCGHGRGCRIESPRTTCSIQDA
jgi:hypothetical protein